MNTTQNAAKNAVISTRIAALLEAGLSHREAIDTVLGVGTFDRIAGEVYEELRAEVGSVA